MKARVTLSGPEVQSILLRYLRDEYKGLVVDKGTYLSASRVGECPPAFEAELEVCRSAPDPRD